ncbi:hypothetical protein [Leptotrichia alba]|uniref:Uncharacterized protein n=1 Tax=Leptotrichia alba TaxID=3239304 RepID=A0AB39V101_9FUSO
MLSKDLILKKREYLDSIAESIKKNRRIDSEVYLAKITKEHFEKDFFRIFNYVRNLLEEDIEKIYLEKDLYWERQETFTLKFKNSKNKNYIAFCFSLKGIYFKYEESKSLKNGYEFSITEDDIDEKFFCEIVDLYQRLEVLFTCRESLKIT